MTKNILSIASIIYVILFFTGCTADLTKPEINFEPPKYVEQMPSRVDQQDFVSTGSIFGQGENPLFADHKAMHVNDIVRVVISETSSSSLSGSKDLTKKDEVSLGGLSFGATGGNNAVNARVTNVNGLTQITGVSTAIGTDNTFSGSGKATKDASFTTTVTARIVKVLANGNYFISGKREILVDEQKQTIQISGVIRPYDIDQFNKIDSAQMSDAKILYKTQGDVDRATEQGWGTAIIQAIWPF